MSPAKPFVVKLYMMDPGDPSVGEDSAVGEVTLSLPFVYFNKEGADDLTNDLKKTLRDYIDHPEGAVLDEKEFRQYRRGAW